jgi:hypothetical protein
VAASQSLRSVSPREGNHGFRFEGIAKYSASKLQPDSQKPENTITSLQTFTPPDQWLGNSSRTTNYASSYLRLAKRAAIMVGRDAMRTTSSVRAGA